ncbi:AAA family ATPase [Cellulomonas sp. PhB143]|uniref:AAA family ATPase n=1 Tax=Cellulomonas sp. PhB143 TaxID=2485186 RepID=UPI0018F320B4|nr:AAA family ATPase [Cellulomonas sp. PhB143]
MQLLGPDDDVVAHLGRAPRRIAVAGTSGAGKTSWGRRIGATLGLPHTEVDALFHGPAWTERPEFLDDVRAVLARDRWVCDYQYPAARPLISSRADVVLWLDLPVRTRMRQVVRRTWRRWRTREELWNGNLEPVPWSLWRGSKSIIVWAWTSRHSLDDLPGRLTTEAPGTALVRVGSHAEAERWLARLVRSTGA